MNEMPEPDRDVIREIAASSPVEEDPFSPPPSSTDEPATDLLVPRSPRLSESGFGWSDSYSSGFESFF